MALKKTRDVQDIQVPLFVAYTDKLRLNGQGCPISARNLPHVVITSPLAYSIRSMHLEYSFPTRSQVHGLWDRRFETGSEATTDHRRGSAQSPRIKRNIHKPKAVTLIVIRIETIGKVYCQRFSFNSRFSTGPTLFSSCRLPNRFLITPAGKRKHRDTCRKVPEPNPCKSVFMSLPSISRKAKHVQIDPLV